jgi:hypothetical protein
MVSACCPKQTSIHYENYIKNSNSTFYFHVTVPSRYLQWLSCIVTGTFLYTFESQLLWRPARKVLFGDVLSWKTKWRRRAIHLLFCVERQPHSYFQICLYLWFGEGGGEYLCVVIWLKRLVYSRNLGGVLLILMEGQLLGKN